MSTLRTTIEGQSAHLPSEPPTVNVGGRGMTWDQAQELLRELCIALNRNKRAPPFTVAAVENYKIARADVAYSMCRFARSYADIKRKDDPDGLLDAMATEIQNEANKRWPL